MKDSNRKKLNILREALSESADKSKAPFMEAYMRNQFRFLGVMAPKRKAIVKTLFPVFDWDTNDEFYDFIYSLWLQEEREFALCGVDLSIKMIKNLNTESIPFFEKLVKTKAWWDTVDGIVPSVLGPILLSEPILRNQYLDKWIHSDWIWDQRAALILQLKYKRRLDFNKLKELILLRSDSKEFFVCKAMGWALREYSKVDSADVEKFILNNKIPSLAAREGIRLILKK